MLCVVVSDSDTHYIRGFCELLLVPCHEKRTMEKRMEASEPMKKMQEEKKAK